MNWPLAIHSEPFIDVYLLACIAFLWTCAVVSIAYIAGRRHGYDDGYIKGLEAEHAANIPKLIKAKFDGFRSGRIAGLMAQNRRLTEMLDGIPHQHTQN